MSLANSLKNLGITPEELGSDLGFARNEVKKWVLGIERAPKAVRKYLELLESIRVLQGTFRIDMKNYEGLVKENTRLLTIIEQKDIFLNQLQYSIKELAKQID